MDLLSALNLANGHRENLRGRGLTDENIPGWGTNPSLLGAALTLLTVCWDVAHSLPESPVSSGQSPASGPLSTTGRGYSFP